MFSYFLVIFAYLLGSVSSAIIVCKIMAYPDPRTQGSHNPGATNVLRFAGKKAAAFTLLGDVFKGFIPVLLAHLLGVDETILALTMLAAFLGHIYPVFFSFQGGKGVATAFGTLLACSPWVGVAVLGTWLLMAAIFKISSVSALVSASLAPVYVYLLTSSSELTVASSAMSILLIWRHRSNIQNLLSGKEEKIKSK